MGFKEGGRESSFWGFMCERRNLISRPRRPSSKKKLESGNDDDVTQYCLYDFLCFYRTLTKIWPERQGILWDKKASKSVCGLVFFFIFVHNNVGYFCSFLDRKVCRCMQQCERCQRSSLPTYVRIRTFLKKIKRFQKVLFFWTSWHDSKAHFNPWKRRQAGKSDFFLVARYFLIFLKRIYGGEDAKDHAYPWMAHICFFHVPTGTFLWQCTFPYPTKNQKTFLRTREKIVFFGYIFRQPPIPALLQVWPGEYGNKNSRLFC